MFGVGAPFDSRLKWAEEVDRVFENFGWGRHVFPSVFRDELEEMNWLPALEVSEKGGQFVVRAELPGLRKEDINVDVEDEMLTLRGERKHEKEETKEHFYRSERSYGSFYRAIPLPEGVKTENAKAIFKDGVLEITMPAPPVIQKRTRHVEIGEAPVKEAGKAAA
jgi:HSP20 family protein